MNLAGSLISVRKMKDCGRLATTRFAIELRSFASWPATKFLRKNISRSSNPISRAIGTSRIFLSSAGRSRRFEFVVVPLWRDAMRAFLNCLRHASQREAPTTAAFGLTRKIDIVSLCGHELSQSLCGSVLLHYPADRRLDVCLSWGAISAGHIRRDARFRQDDDAGRWLDSTRRGLADCIWITNPAGRIHLQRRDGGSLFYDSRGQRRNADGQVFPDLERRTASFQQRRIGHLLLLVFLVRRVLRRRPLEHRCD